MATVNRTIGSVEDDTREISTVTGTGPYDITLDGAASFNLVIGDRMEDDNGSGYVISAVTSSSAFEITDFATLGAPIVGPCLLSRFYTTLTLADAVVNTDSAAGDTLNWKVMNDALISDSPFIGSMDLGTGGTLNITVPASERHGGVVGAGARIQSDGANNTTIFFSVSSTPTTTIEFLEIIGFGDTALSTNALSISTLSSGSTLTLNALIIHGWNATSTNSVGGIVTGSLTDGAVDIFNCLIYDFTSASSGDGKGIVLDDGSAGTIRILNCTIDVEDKGIDALASTSRRIQNDAVFATTAFSGASGWNASSGNNCTSDSSAPGSSNQVSKTNTDQFVDLAAEDFVPKIPAGSLDDNGADLSGIFPDDIKEVTRSTLWTIGSYHDVVTVEVPGGVGGFGGPLIGIGGPGVSASGGEGAAFFRGSED